MIEGRLDPKTMAVALRWLLAPLAGAAVLLLIGGGRLGTDRLVQLGIGAVVFAAIAGGDLMRYITTRYRITDDRVELNSGLINRRHLSIPRDRIRTVDLTSGPFHRIFGLSVVVVGTGQQSASDSNELKLDAVATGEAARLRSLLLEKPVDVAAEEPSAEAADEAPIARIDWRWLRFAPLTGWALLIGLAPVGLFYRALEVLGIKPNEVGLIRAVYNEVSEVAIWLVILVLAGLVLVTGVAGAMLFYVESWWGFRLERGSGSFHVRRGLLTTRSLTLEQRRLRGVELAEPLPLRWGNGARLKAVATGLGSHKKGGEKSDQGALLPPAPLAEAHRVATRVLEGDDPIDSVRLRAHPRAALRRRMVRVLAVAIIIIGAVAAIEAAASWMPGWAWLATAVLVLPSAVAVGRDSYRSLGHGLSGDYLITRHGSGVRRTVALQRTGVIGWTITRSPFQRQAGLATLSATTAAGSGVYHTRDVDLGEGLTFADEAVPGLLTPFLDR